MKLRFCATRHQIHDTYSFDFESQETITWMAGQSIKLELPAGYGVQERRFSISSAPYENIITVTTRISDSSFKQALMRLEVGDLVDAYSIQGDFVWPETIERPIFCAGGIGITACRSILKQRQYDGRILDSCLLYTYKAGEGIFESELRELEAGNADFLLSLLPDQRISPAVIERHEPDWRQRTIYLAGPEAMVNEVGAELMEDGLPEVQLQRDWYTGRSGWED